MNAATHLAGGRRAGLVACLVTLVWTAVFAGGVSDQRGRGWDEAMHAELPAAHMALALRAGEPGEAFAVLLDCQQYPFAYPVVLAAAYAGLGVDEMLGRRIGRILQGLGLLGLFLLGRALVARLERDRELPPWRDLVPWLAMALGALSPMWLAYSGTFFLEGPFLVVAIFALRAWLRRGEGRSPHARELAAGAWLALAFFTKFNYALALGLALFVDLALDGVQALRAGALRGFLARTASLAAIPLASFAWWFVWPLPGTRVQGRAHWDAFTAFLGGNRHLAATGWDRRLWDWGTFLASGPLLLAVLLVGAALGLRFAARPGARALALAFVVGGLPVWLHTFHLDRFLLPGLASLAPLAALGLAWTIGRAPRAGVLALCAIAVTGVVTAKPLAGAYAGALGLLPDAPAARAYLAELHAERLDLLPGRPLPTAGLERPAHDAFLDAIAGELGPDARVAFLGVNSELSPGALHLGLLARGGSPERLRRDARRVREDGQPEMVVTFEAADPGWTPERLRAWAQGFDVVLTTDPTDWKGRRGREFVDTYRGWLFGAGEWSYRSLGTIAVARPGGAPVAVELYACRRSEDGTSGS